tara:strand:- start:53 stop:724 length:672 start_codon:yes stop_codon:yes gene_type:complete
MSNLNFIIERAKSLFILLAILSSLPLKAQQVEEVKLVLPKNDSIIQEDFKFFCDSQFYFAKIIKGDSIKLIEEASETHYSLNQFLLFDSLNFEKRYEYVFNTLKFKKDSLIYRKLCFEIRFLYCVNQILTFDKYKIKSELLKKLFLNDVVKKEIYSANEEIDFVLTQVFISDPELVLSFLNKAPQKLKESLILNMEMILESINFNLEETRKENFIKSLRKLTK